MSPLSLMPFIAGLDAPGGGALHENFTMPSIRRHYNIQSIGAPGAITSAAADTDYMVSLDVTGGQISRLPEEMLLRLACLMYVCVMPSAGVKDAFEHVKDTCDWYNRTATADKIEFNATIHGTALDAIAAPRFVIEEE